LVVGGVGPGGGGRGDFGADLLSLGWFEATFFGEADKTGLLFVGCC